ncbi:MAG: two-component sensor histidine kinase [Ilumatobacteraceae bacterium]|nr:two-component sensor histidine kinase [Ilumatobacteraceae bacterium]
MNRRYRLGSVRARITLLSSLALAIGLLLGGRLLFDSLRDGLIDAKAGSGPARAAELAALAGRAPLPAILPALEPADLTVLQIVDSTGHVTAASQQLSGTPALVGANDVHRSIRESVPGTGEGPWLIEPTRATLGGRSEVVVVITSLHDQDANVEVLRNRLVVAWLLLVAAVAALIWLVVGRTLRSVDRMRLNVQEITASRLDQRVAVPTGDDEIARLALTLNDMLDRLQIGGDAQQRFVADASHELRTPIAISRTTIEVAAARPEAADWPAVSAKLLAQNERMEHLTDDLLLLARSGGGREARAAALVDVGELVLRAMDRVVPGDRRLVLRGSPPLVSVSGDRDQLDRMLLNVIENALRHARHTVTVEAAAGSTSIELRVSDDGDGIDPADRDSVFRPFVRLDDHRTRSSGGTGLGLAIVKQIVEGHRGTIRIVDNQPGATFVIRLPISESSQEDPRKVAP